MRARGSVLLGASSLAPCPQAAWPGVSRRRHAAARVSLQVTPDDYIVHTRGFAPTNYSTCDIQPGKVSYVEAQVGGQLEARPLVSSREAPPGAPPWAMRRCGHSRTGDQAGGFTLTLLQGRAHGFGRFAQGC